MGPKPRHLVGMLVLVGLTLSACSSDSADVAELQQRIEELEAQIAPTSSASISTTLVAPATSTSTTLAPTTTQGLAEPEIEVAWFFSSGDFFRFVAFVTNPNEVGLRGTQVHWEAKDSSGALVGSFRKRFPPIEPGLSFPYVGGAGGLLLSGSPASVEVLLDVRGSETSSPTPLFEVSDIEFRRETFSSDIEYLITATITTANELMPSDEIDIAVVLRNANGDVVGGTFGSPDNLPGLVLANTRFVAEIGFIPATEEATTAEVFAYRGSP